MKLIFDTNNPAKLDYMKHILDKIGLDVVGLDQQPCILPNVEEDGNTPLENACIKAKQYYQVLQQPLFACDSGLYFNDIPNQYQPGVHVRKPNGVRLSDDEMITWYSNLAKRFHGLQAYYVNAICLIIDEQHIYRSDDSSLWSHPFSIIATPHQKRMEGFPLDCLSTHIKTGTYFYDDETAYDDRDEIGIIKFFEAHKLELMQYGTKQ